MNIDTLIEQYKCKKIGNPVTALPLLEIDSEVFNSVRNKIAEEYDLASEDYATQEKVFFNTRRIVTKTKHIKTEKQLYTSADFDTKLLDIIQPLLDVIKTVVPNSDATLVQIATILPSQQLMWHVDTFLYQQFSNKIHVPLFSNNQSFYDVYIDNTVRRIHMNEGKIWNINNLDLHRSINLGTTIRSHLIIDFIDNNVLDVLNDSGINYFHHRLEHMSKKGEDQLLSLRKNYA